MRILVRCVPLLVIAFSLVGCTSQPRKTNAFADQNYASEFSVKDKFYVRFDGKCTVEEDKDGTVHVFGYPQTNNNTTTKPSVKISGKGIKFKVYDCGRVLVDNGATLTISSCPDVRAKAGTTVYAYNCGLVKYQTGAVVEAHGNTQTEVDDTDLPAAQPAQPGDKGK